MVCAVSSSGAAAGNKTEMIPSAWAKTAEIWHSNIEQAITVADGISRRRGVVTIIRARAPLEIGRRG